ncbi:hypothetical protein ACFOHS_16235 [Jhaorihella thermophila]
MKGYSANGRDFKVHIDGYDLLPYFKGEVAQGPRKEFFYWTDDGDLAALRYGRWKMVFMEQRAHGFSVWEEPLVTLRLPKLFDMRGDPFERADHEIRKLRALAVQPRVPGPAGRGLCLAAPGDLYRLPPRQEPGSFNLGDALEKLRSNPN